MAGLNFKGVRTAASGYMKSGIVASGQYVLFGAFVARSADGTVKSQVTNEPYDYLGVANDDVRSHQIDGFYSANEKVPYIINGTANVWLLGGQTIDSGDFIRFPTTLGAGTESLGVVMTEGTPTTRTTKSIGRVVDAADSGSADYDQLIASISGDTVTMANAPALTALDLSEGDVVVLDSDEAAEVTRVVDPAASTTAFTVNKTPLATHVNNKTAYKCTQIEVDLMQIRINFIFYVQT